MQLLKNLSLSLVFFLAVCSCEGPLTPSSDSDLAKQIYSYLEDVKSIHEVPGMAVAVLKDGEVLYQHTLGLASIEKQEPLNAHHMLRVYSTTKLLVSTAIFQLVQKGELSINDSIGQYLSDIPTEWGEVRIADLLAHASGLPDIVRYDNALDDETLIQTMAADGFDFEPGERFRYNQTNYWFLARIIEKVSGKPFPTFLLENQFPNDTAEVLISSNSAVEIPNRISKYEFDHAAGEYKPTRYHAGVRGHAGNGLNISLQDFIKWAQAFHKGEFLKEKAIEQMWTPYPFHNVSDNFLHGWGTYKMGNVQSNGFTGGTVSGFRIFPQQNLTLIYLSSGYRYLPIHNMVIDHVAKMVDTTLTISNYLIEEQLAKTFLKDSIEQALIQYTKIKEENPTHNFEGSLNTLGYAVKRSGRLQDAIRIFQLNVEEYPESSNVYDSLGEAYLDDGQLDKALENYSKALERNPQNAYIKGMIQKIEQELAAQRS